MLGNRVVVPKVGISCYNSGQVLLVYQCWARHSYLILPRSAVQGVRPVHPFHLSGRETVESDVDDLALAISIECRGVLTI